MKKVYLHIGTHKTGTTAVQAFSKYNTDKISARGVLYPKTGLPFLNEMNTGQHLLPWMQMNRPSMPHRWGKYLNDKAKVWVDLRNEMLSSSCSTVLISSEEFDALTDNGVGYVAEQLKEFDVTILCYLRRLDEFVESFYSTNVIYFSEKRDLNSYYEGMGAAADYFSIINRWKKYFGESNVKVLFYHRAALKNEDIVVDVFDRMGVDITDLRVEADTKSVNSIGLPWYAIEAVRALNSMSTPRETIKVFVKILRKIYRKKNFTKHSVINPDLRNKLISVGIDNIKKINTPFFTPELESAFSKRPEDIEQPVAQNLKSTHKAMEKCFEDIAQQLGVIL